MHTNCEHWQKGPSRSLATELVCANDYAAVHTMLSSYSRTCREDCWLTVPELEDESTLHRQRGRGRGNPGVRALRDPWRSRSHRHICKSSTWAYVRSRRELLARPTFYRVVISRAREVCCWTQLSKAFWGFPFVCYYPACACVNARNGVKAGRLRARWPEVKSN